MSQVGKYLNLHPHMQSWAVYNENGPYTKPNAIGNLAPAQFGGLSYMILAEKGNDTYVIQTESFGRCAIWAPRYNDSTITFERTFINGDSTGSGGGSLVPGGGGGTGKFLNLHPHMQSWAVYNINGPYTKPNAIGNLAPAQFGGLSYSILEEKGGDIYIIQTESFGKCAIWAPRDNDSSITSSPQYSNGDTSGGGSSSGGNYLNLHAHMQSWAVYNENGPYTKPNAIGNLAPAQFGGLSYRILAEKGNDVYVIQTESFGRCAIWAPRDNDSSITSSPQYSNGDTSSGGSTGGGDIGDGNVSFNMVSRSEWGANPVIQSGMSGLRTEPYKYIIIHHSGSAQLNSDIAQMKSIQSYHQSLDWGDIGYNFGIGKYGTVMQGRETKYVGAHTRADKIPNAGNIRNEDSIGICLFGNLSSEKPGPTQLLPLTGLLASLCKDFNISPDNIKGHIDFSSTSCPGSFLYPLLPQIIQNVKNILLNPPTPFELLTEICKLASQYIISTNSNSSTNKVILDYLRHIKYSNEEWTQLFGKVDMFVDYIKTNHNSLHLKFLKYISNDSEFFPFEGNLIDLPHLAATTLGYNNGLTIVNFAVPKHWTGWGGDLATAMADVTRIKLENYPSFTEQYIADNYVIANSSSSFSLYDLNADIDAIFFSDYALSNISRFDSLFSKYYTSVSSKIRKDLFIKTIETPNTTLNTIYARIKELMVGTSGFAFPEGYGDKLRNKSKYNGINPSIETINAACYSFAKYIYSL